MNGIPLFKIILVGFFVIGGLVGLFVFSTYKGDGGDTAGVGNVLVWGVLPQEDVQDALNSISVFNRSIQGVLYTRHDVDRFENDLSTAIATGNSPDLVLISQEQLLSLRNLLQVIPPAALSTRTFQSTFVDEGQLFQAPNGMYGVPFLVDPLVLYYNKSILSSAGIATPPSSWEAMTGLVPKVTVLSSAGKITRSLIALGSYDNVTSARGILSALFLQTRVPLSTLSNTGVLGASLGSETATGSGTPPGESVVRFYTQFADSTKLSYTWNASLPSSEHAFQVGDLALYLGYASRARFLKEANPNLNFDVAPLPQAKNATTKTTYGLTYAFALPRGAKNPGGGLQAALLLTGSAEQQTAVRATGLAPTTRAVISQGTDDPVLSVAYTSALYAKGWLSPAPARTNQVFGAMITNVTSGRLTIQEALGAAEGSLNALLQQ